MDLVHFRLFQIEIRLGVIILTFTGIVIQHTASEVERALKAFAWAVFFTHFVHLISVRDYLVAHDVLLVAMYVLQH